MMIRRSIGGIKGFTLIELMVVIAMLGIIAAIAAPSILDWRMNYQYRQTSRGVMSVLREAKNRAIASNKQYMVEFQPANSKYLMKEGSRAVNTPSSGWTTIASYDITLPAGMILRSGDCTSTSNVYVQCNPNSTATLATPDLLTFVTNATICISDSSAAKYQIQLLRSGLFRMIKQ